MEKFSQFRDRGSGVSPFLPSTTSSSAPVTATHIVLFLFRLPFFVAYAAAYFLVLQHLPLPAVARKLLLWGLLGIPGIWWVDLQLDGVKRGSLSQQPASRVPHPRSVVAASWTSPLDALYLAAVFDPIFTLSRPGSRRVRRVGLLGAVLAALSPAQLRPAGPEDDNAPDLTDLRALLDRYPDRVIAVFPEAGTTNGKGVLPFSPSLLSVPSDVPIFPISLRYTPQDVTTPLPGAWATFLWKLLGRPTHSLRVRIAEGTHNTSTGQNGTTQGSATAVDFAGTSPAARGDDSVTAEEQRVLDRVAEALARLGRNKRVGLTLRDKAAFVEAWKKSRK